MRFHGNAILRSGFFCIPQAGARAKGKLQGMFATCKSMIRAVAICAMVSFGFAGAAGSATLPIASILGGDLSSIWPQPKPADNGLSDFSLTSAPRPKVSLVLPQYQVTGRQLTISVSAISGPNLSYASGGAVLCSTSPFRWRWDAGSKGLVMSGFWQLKRTVTLSLRLTNAGAVHLTVDFRDAAKATVANSVSKTLVAVAYATPPDTAAVPLPGAAGMLAAGLGALALCRRRRHRSTALTGQPAKNG